MMIPQIFHFKIRVSYKVLIVLLVLTFQNGIGQAQGQSNYPERIISLAPSLTKNLYLLEADNLLVGCTNYCSLQSDTRAEVIANAVKVNYEKAILLKADLIITTDLTPIKNIETFQKYGIDVRVFPNPKSFGEICDQFMELGQILGRGKKAEHIIKESKKKLEELKKKVVKSEESLQMFMQLGANPLFAVLPGTFMNDLISFSGYNNMAEELNSGAINKEYVLLKDPDVIIIVLMGSLGEDERQNWMKFQSVEAVKRGKVFLLGADNACSPTPVSFVKALEELLQLLQENERP